MRLRIAFITSPASRSSRSAQLPLWSGVSTSTSWMPLADACVNTGPRFVTVIGSSPENAGYRFGTTRTCHLPLGPYVSSAGGVASSLPGQNGHGRAGSASTCMWRCEKSPGRSDRSNATVTHRPVSGFSRSWLNAAPPGPSRCSNLTRVVEGHVHGITVGVRVAVPARPPLRQPQPCLRRHRVERRRAAHAEHPRSPVDAALVHLDVLTDDDGRVVPGSRDGQHHALGGHRAELDRGSRRVTVG